MVAKRERLSHSWCKIKRDIFLKQAEMFNNSLNYKENEKQAILNANHGDTVMSSCHTSSNPSINSILSGLGEKTFPRKERKEHGAPKHCKSSSPSPLQRLPNLYAKQYLSNVIKRSQRSSTESCTEQDAKWKAMSENQKASHQKSKDIANKLAALQEAYKLKPVQIVVVKLPEDHDACLQFSKFNKRANISPSKRNSRSRDSLDKVHSEPLNKKAKLCLNSRTKATKCHSKNEIKESISSKADIKLLPENIVHNTYDSNREEVGEDLINHSENEHFSNVEKKIEISNDNNNENKFHKHNANNLLDIQNENNTSNILMQEVYEVNNHFEENNLSSSKEDDNDQLEHWRQQENNFDKNKKAVETYVSNKIMKNEFHNHEKDGNLVHKQEEQMHINHREKEIDITGMFDQRIHDINTHKKKDIVCNGKREENLVVNHNKGIEKHHSKTEVVNYEQAQEEAVNYTNKDNSHRKEENEHINHKKWENKKCPSEIGVLNHDMCTDYVMKENKINIHENDENEISIDKEKNKKCPKVHLINDKQKECEINSLKIVCELDSHNDIQKKHNDHKNVEKVVDCYNGQENHFTSDKQKEVDNVLTEGTESDIHKKCETEFTKHKKMENQQYRREHKLLKYVKVIVQRYMGGNIEEMKNILNTKLPNKEISVNSSGNLENFPVLCGKTEHSEFPGRSVVEDTKDIHLIDSPKPLPNKCTQAAILQKPIRNEEQIVKKPNMGQLYKKPGNSEKILSSEQKLMNSERLCKEDIIIPAKPFVDNSKLQKSNKHNKLYANSHKLKGKVHFYNREKLKNATKHLNQPNVRCNERERTPRKKPENSLISVKSHTKELVKDLSRHSDLEIEVQKSNLRDKKPQIIHEKLVSNTLVKDNLDSGSCKEDYCKDACSKLPVSRHNVFPISNNSEIFNKKFSSKSNMHKYNSVPEKLHFSSSSNHAQSSLPLNKDTVSGKEKLRQESAKIRESVFASSCAAKPLSGYKIPKKSRTDFVENNCAQSNQDTSKLSPLYEVCQIPQTETYSHNGYHTDRNFRGSKYSPRIKNGEQHSEEQKLILKLSKDTSYSRWQRDSFGAVPNNFAFPSLGRNAHCDRSCAPVDSSLLSASTDTGGYWVCEDSTGNVTKHFPQNVQNGDYGLS